MSELKKMGFVVLVGRSNVGKSTLLNTLVGTKVSITTPKPQTTRHPARGIFHDKRGQIVFVDTPGIFLGKKDHVSHRLNQIVEEQLEGIEAVVYVVDPSRLPGVEEERIQQLLRATSIPVLLAINKCDLSPDELPALELMRSIDVGQRGNYEVSANKSTGLKALIDGLFTIIPDGEAFYPEQQLTDIGNQEWLSELIREKVFLKLEQELPYTVHVEVTRDEVQDNGLRAIEATVWTTEERYKGMIVGAKAQMIKQISMDVRKELELVTGQKVFLRLEVAVDSKWQQRFR
ncbi:GTPase Era [Patescibacteria group bacterium]|nr:GTPase Era [Patescibacteria group bacterium]